MNRFGVFSLLTVISLVAPSSAIDCTNPPRRTRFQHCCNFEDIISLKIQVSCLKTLAKDAKKGHFKFIPNACALDCFLSKTGVMKGDDVDPDKLTKYLKSAFAKRQSMIPVIHKAFTTCNQKIKALHADMKKNPPKFPKLGKTNCKGCAGALLNCVKMETIFNCPAKQWRNEPKCNAHREFYKKCNPKLHPHLH